MNLTNEMMQRYLSGQVEIFSMNPASDDYRYRGQIKKIEVIPDASQEGFGNQPANLHVEFDYICKLVNGEGYKPDENKPYDVALSICGASDIGMDRIAISSSILGEMAVFYPSTHHKRILADGQFESDDF